MTKQILTLPGLITGIVLLGACGSTQPPTQELAETRMIIQQAEQVGADDYAPLELREARRKLESAREAVDEDEFEEAIRLIEQAKVDAELAHMKTLSGKSQMAVRELREGIRILREEIDRNRGNDQ